MLAVACCQWRRVACAVAVRSVAILRDYITQDVCSAVSRGLFSQHRVTYALLTAIQIGLSYSDWVSQEEFDTLLRIPEPYVPRQYRHCCIGHFRAELLVSCARSRAHV